MPSLSKQARYPGWRTMTAAQRRNAKAEALFAYEKANRKSHYDCGVCGGVHPWMWPWRCTATTTMEADHA